MTPSGELRRRAVDPHPARMDERPRAPHASSDVPVTLGVAAAHAIGRSAPTATDPATAQPATSRPEPSAPLTDPCGPEERLVTWPGAASSRSPAPRCSSSAAPSPRPLRPPPSRTSRPRTPATTTTPRWSPRSRPSATAHPDIVQRVQHRQELPGARPLGGQDQRQRQRRRARARGPVRRPPSRPRAHDGRAGALPLHAARERLRPSTRPSRNLVNSREIFIIFAINPDGFRYDLTGRARTARGARTASRTPAPAPSAPTSTATTTTDWGCCGGSSGNPSSITYRGAKAFSAPETQAFRDFVNGPGRRTASSRSPSPHHAPHERRADPVAVRLHEDQHPGRHDQERLDDVRDARSRHGGAQWLYAAAVVRPVHHRRRPDRLAVRQAPDLLVHLGAVPDRDADRVGRPLPGRREHRPPDRAQPLGAHLVPAAGRLPVPGGGPPGPELRRVLRRRRGDERAGRRTRTARTPPPAAAGSGRIPHRRPRTGSSSSARPSRARARSSPAAARAATPRTSISTG